jgi:hypothetical protein
LLQRGSPGHYKCFFVCFVSRNAMLTECAAVEIYKMKLNLLQPRKTKQPVSIWGQTRSVAKLFGVSSRTVKYVWNRQTWSHATDHLWASESEIQEAGISRHLKMVTSFQIQTLLCFVFSFLISEQHWCWSDRQDNENARWFSPNQVESANRSSEWAGSLQYHSVPSGDPGS